MTIRKFSKVGVLFLALVLALGGVGAAFASWTDTLTIGGTVTTGDVKLCLAKKTTMVDTYSPGEPPDYLSPPYDWTWDGEEIRELDKNVGWGNYTYVDADEDGCFEALDIVLNNVYPSYYNNFSVYPRNNGSIPVKIVGAILSWDGEEYLFLPGQTTKSIDLSGNGIDDLEIWYGDAFGRQLHQDDPFCSEPEISIGFHVLQDEGEGVQGQSFSFTIEIVAVQWNKYGTYILGDL